MTETHELLQIAVGSSRFQLQIPKDAFQCQSWTGSVTLTQQPLNGRQKAITQCLQDKKTLKDFVRATIEERKVIRAWNRSKYIKALDKAAERESRNYPVPFQEIAALLPLVRKALRVVGGPSIIRSIETYFDFCSTGGHIWDERNHGFKTLAGLLEKLLVLKKSNTRAWWDVRDTPHREIVDDHARLTRRIADSFAQTFLNEETFQLDEGSKSHVHFQRAAARMVRFISRQNRRGVELTQSDMIRYLLECVQDLFNQQGDIIYPAHLSSETIWDAALPEYLKEKGIV